MKFLYSHNCLNIVTERPEDVRRPKDVSVFLLLSDQIDLCA